MSHPISRMAPFRKMNGLGNDFAIVDARTRPLSAPTPAVIARIAERAGGIGFDQMILIEADSGSAGRAGMRIFNADGGEVEACGNATRCVADILLAESGADEVEIGTSGGRLRCWRDGQGIAVTFEPPRFDWADIPLAGPVDDVLAVDAVEAARAAGLPAGAVVNVGNPHVVYWVDRPEAVALEVVGPRIEHDPLFPKRVNVSFAAVVAENRILARVWERGAGATRACGTAACAVAILAARSGRTGRLVTVELPGGDLGIDWRDDGTIVMTGPVAYEFDGLVDPETGEWRRTGAQAT